MTRSRLLTLACTVALTCATVTAPAVAADGVPAPATPFQSALQEAIAARVAAGLPVPDVTYTSDGAAPALAAAAAADTPTTITSTTVITYAGPDEAGYATWPALVLEDNLPPGATGTVDAGD